MKYSEIDKFDYVDIVKKLEMNDLIECKIIQSDSRIAVMYSAYKFIKAQSVKNDYAYLGDYYNRVSRVLGYIFSKKSIVLGDGAGIIWGLGDKLYYNEFLFETLPFKLFNMQTIYELEKTVDKSIFTKNWKFIKDKYQNLELRDEVWIIGSSTPFVEIVNINSYSGVAKEFYENGGWEKQVYFLQIKEILDSFKSYSKYKYFPHRMEKITSEHINLGLNINEEDIFLELMPLYLGYLPKILIGTSTTVFSYLNFKKILDKDMEIYHMSQSENIDRIYSQYGAKIFYFSDYN